MSTTTWKFYSLALTAGVAAALLMGASNTRSAKFDVIDVKRINVREPDGTLRMVVSSNGLFPGAIIKDKEYPHPRKQAGILFFNDEGTEAGGLVYAGKRGADGKVDSGLSLTFDRYEQDQQLQLLGVDGDGRHFAGLIVNDRPDRPIGRDFEEKATLEAMPAAEREALMKQRAASNYYGARRVYVGKSPGQSSVLQLADANGKPRLTLMVTPQGEASIQFLDAAGKPVREIKAQELASAK